MVLLYNVGDLRKVPCPFGHGHSVEYIISKEKENVYLVQVVKPSDRVGKEIYFSKTVVTDVDDVGDLVALIKGEYLSEFVSLLEYGRYLAFMSENFEGDLQSLEEEFFLALDRNIIEKGVWHPSIAGIYLFKVLGPDAMKTILQEDCDTSTLSSLIMGMLQKCGEPSILQLLQESGSKKEPKVIELSSIFNKKDSTTIDVDKSLIEDMEIQDLLGYGLCFNLFDKGNKIASLECITYLEDHVVIELTSNNTYDEVIKPTDSKKRLCITKLNVDSDKRRKGIGTAFVGEVLKRIKANGKEVVILQAHPTDDGTIEDLIKFYSKFGFEIIYDKPTNNKFNRMVLMLLHL